MQIERIEWITREMVQANRHKIFLFGDNLLRRGLGGQAREMRGERNAVGIPVKNRPSMTEGSFFSDVHYRSNVTVISVAFAEIWHLWSNLIDEYADQMS